MSNSKTQEERLDYLVEEFKADSDEYKDLQTSKKHRREKTDPSIAYEYSYAERIVL